MAAFNVLQVRHKNNELRTRQHRGPNNAGAMMDQATRAMTAVFFSNFVLGFPHAVFHLMIEQPLYISISIHLFFYTHFIVDPIVFIWFNNNHRQRVHAGLRTLLRWCSSTSPTESTPLPLPTSSTNITNNSQATYDTTKPSTKIPHLNLK